MGPEFRQRYERGLDLALGKTSMCIHCNKPILWDGTYWSHRARVIEPGSDYCTVAWNTCAEPSKIRMEPERDGT